MKKVRVIDIFSSTVPNEEIDAIGAKYEASLTYKEYSGLPGLKQVIFISEQTQALFGLPIECKKIGGILISSEVIDEETLLVRRSLFK